MDHQYMLIKRIGGGVIPLSEESIRTLIYHGEIVHEHSSQVGTEKTMNHYYKFKEIKR